MLTALVSPSFSVTVTWYSPAPSVWSFGGTNDEAAGKSAMICVGLSTVNCPDVSSTPPTWRFATSGTPLCSKFVPVIVTLVSGPDVRPEAGLRFVTVGRVTAGAWLQR